MSAEPQASSTRPSSLRRILRWALQTVLHFIVWIALSGHTEIEFLVMGVAAAVSATAVSNWLFHGLENPLFAGARPTYGWMLRVGLRFALYVPWLLKEIVLSNLYVAWLILQPKPPIDPCLVEFETTLTSERAQVLLAQSITLTPGTVTVDASNYRFVIHCLSLKSRAGIEDGSIQRKVAAIFAESAPDAVVLRDITSADEVPL